MCLVAEINPFIMFYHSHARKTEGEREGERERETSHCDQKNFWGVSRSRSAAVSSMIVVTRYFIDRGEEGNFDPRARLSRSKRGVGVVVSVCVKYPPHLLPGTLFTAKSEEVSSLVS